MKSTKHLGIWMDHSIAYLTIYKDGKIVTNTVEALSKLSENGKNIGMDESLTQNKEHNLLMAYFKKLSDVIKEFDEVLLFGPTSAKNELFNLLRKNHLFEKIKIELKPADKMTENQQHVFVREYFISM